jgi:hypothetical protein
LHYWHLLNAIVIGNCRGDFKVLSYNPFLPSRTQIYEIDPEVTAIERVFNNKLKNVYGHRYKAVGYVTISYQAREELKYELAFIKAFSKYVNGKFSVTLRLSTEYLADISSRYDLLLNTNVTVSYNKTSNYIKKVNLYEVFGLCALVPFKPNTSRFDFMFRPFDLWTWIGIFTSFLLLTLAWKFLNRSTRFQSQSSLHFAFTFISSFLGQPTPLRAGRFTQKVILQLTIFATFVLGTAYQSIILSYFTLDTVAPRISTVDGLFGQNFTFLMNQVSERLMRETDVYEKMKPNVKVLSSILKSLEEHSEANEVIIDWCHILDKELIKHSSNVVEDDERDPNEFYYKLNEMLYVIPKAFYVSFFTPFYAQFKDFSLRVFESGLKEAWQHSKRFEYGAIRKEHQFYENEEYYMKLKDIAPAFYLIAIGLAASALAFTVEIAIHAFKSRCCKRKSKPNVVIPAKASTSAEQ